MPPAQSVLTANDCISGPSPVTNLVGQFMGGVMGVLGKISELLGLYWTWEFDWGLHRNLAASTKYCCAVAEGIRVLLPPLPFVSVVPGTLL